MDLEMLTILLRVIGRQLALELHFFDSAFLAICFLVVAAPGDRHQ